MNIRPSSAVAFPGRPRSFLPPPSPDGLAVADHLAEPARLRGTRSIYAGHRPESFRAALTGHGLVTGRAKPMNPLPGIETVRYRIEMRDAQGKPTGSFGPEHTKTLFSESHYPRARLAQLADVVFRFAAWDVVSYVKFGQDYVYVVRDGPGGVPRTMGFEPEAVARGHLRRNPQLRVVERPVCELAAFFAYPSARVTVAGT